MISILIAGNEKNNLAGLLEGLARDANIETRQAASMEEAFDILSKINFDLVVADENISGISGLAFSEKLVSVNPLINCAVVSSLSPKEFHEASEGLGVLMQLSVGADENQATLLVDRLKQVLNLTDKSKQ